MKIKYIRDSHWSQALSSPSSDTENSPRRKFRCVGLGQPSPKDHKEVQNISRDIDRSPTVLVEQRDPEQTRNTLQQSTIVEEVRSPTDPVGHCRVAALLEVGRDLDHGDRRTSGHEIAHEHSQRDEDRDVDFVTCRPAKGVVGIEGGSRCQDDLVRVLMAETNVAQVVEVETSMGLAVLNMDHVFHILIGHREKARLSRWF